MGCVKGGHLLGHGLFVQDERRSPLIGLENQQCLSISPAVEKTTQHRHFRAHILSHAKNFLQTGRIQHPVAPQLQLRRIGSRYLPDDVAW